MYTANTVSEGIIYIYIYIYTYIYTPYVTQDIPIKTCELYSYPRL